MFMFLLLSFGPLFAICSSPGYILKEANYIPRNYQEYLEMNKHIQCKSSAQKIVYLLDSIKEKTLIGCFHEDFIYGKYCPEYNSGIAQPKFKASCANFTITPCPLLYNLSESYFYFECYEKFGAISSPETSQQEIHEMKKREKNFMGDIYELNLTNANLEKELNLLRERYQNLSKLVNISSQTCDKLCNGTWKYVVLAISNPIIFVFILVIVYCLFILFLIRKFIYKESITYKDFFQIQKNLLGELLFCISTVSDNCEHDTGSNAEGACGVVKGTVSPVLNQSTIPPVSQESDTSPLLITGNTSATEECHGDAPVTVPPVSNTGPSVSGPPLSQESDTSPLIITRNTSATEESHVDITVTVPPVSNTVPSVSGPPQSQESDTSTTSFVMHTNQNEDASVTEIAAGTVPPVSNTGGPGSRGSKTSPLGTTGNNNSFVMHTKQDEDPPVTEESYFEVERRETIDLPEHPDEQENTGMDVILNLD